MVLHTTRNYLSADRKNLQTKNEYIPYSYLGLTNIYLEKKKMCVPKLRNAVHGTPTKRSESTELNSEGTL